MQKHMQHMSLDAVIDVETLPFSAALRDCQFCRGMGHADITLGFADLASLTATMKINCWPGALGCNR